MGLEEGGGAVLRVEGGNHVGETGERRERGGHPLFSPEW
jgi:hypothetical protein